MPTETARDRRRWIALYVLCTGVLVTVLQPAPHPAHQHAPSGTPVAEPAGD